MNSSQDEGGGVGETTDDTIQEGQSNYCSSLHREAVLKRPKKVIT